MNSVFSLSKRIVLGLSVVLLMVSSFVFNASPATAANYEVTMGAGGLQFSPRKVAVKPGDTVTFKNGMLAPHNVIFNPSNSADGSLAKTLSHNKLEYQASASFDVTIPEDATSGEYEFFCAPHRGAGMVGKLVVE
ncbi:MAG: plastocyanin [Cyanobacteria bacterium J06592_8]